MNRSTELFNRLYPKIDSVDFDTISQYLSKMDDYGNDNVRTTPYYRFIYCLCKDINPRQVVELGGHDGMSTCIFLAGMPKKSTLISVEIEHDWKYVPEDERLIKLKMNDLDINSYPGDIDLGATDIWFIDTAHEKEQLAKEIELYSHYWKPGTIILLDDVDSPNFNLKDLWRDIKYDKFRTTSLHQHGFGILVI